MADIARARQLRKAETWAEKLMWSWLRDRRFSGYKFRRQHPIGDYCLDFFCEEAALNVELDGSQHGFPDQRKHDLQREKFLQSRGIKTLRFWNSHLRRNAQSIRDTIFNELQARAQHPLSEYTRRIEAVGRSLITFLLTRPGGHPLPSDERGKSVLTPALSSRRGRTIRHPFENWCKP